MPDGRRGASCDSPVSGSSANLRPLRGARPGSLPAMPVPSPSSTSVFHSPQASHLPTPARRGRAAVLADEGEVAAGHCAIRSGRFDKLDVAARVELFGGRARAGSSPAPRCAERVDDGGDAVAPAGVLCGVRTIAPDTMARATRGVHVVDAELEDGAAAALRRRRAGAGQRRVGVALGIGAADREGGAADQR